MRLTETIPESFPGKEFSLEWSDDYYSAYIYEINYIDFGKTTSGQTIIVPDIWYRSFAERDDRYLDSSTSSIGVELLTQGQKNALSIAAGIENKRQEQDPKRNTFAGIREVKCGRSGQLYITATEEGSRMQESQPFAAVGEAEVLGFGDFATYIGGYYGFFEYDKADVESFVPEDLLGKVNAYMFIDRPRQVVEGMKDPKFQISRLMFLDLKTDLDFPIDSIDTSPRWVVA